MPLRMPPATIKQMLILPVCAVTAAGTEFKNASQT
jgi:hypothetical protein